GHRDEDRLDSILDAAAEGVNKATLAKAQRRKGRHARKPARKASEFPLVPTLRVGTHVQTLCVPSSRGGATQSVAARVPTQSVGTRRCNRSNSATVCRSSPFTPGR